MFTAEYKYTEIYIHESKELQQNPLEVGVACRSNYVIGKRLITMQRERGEDRCRIPLNERGQSVLE